MVPSSWPPARAALFGLVLGSAACGGVDDEQLRAEYFELTGAAAFVARDGDDLRLHFAEPATDVVVHATTSPDALRDETPTARLAEGTELRLAGLAVGERRFLHVRTAAAAPFVVAERRIALEGADNTRDLGGYAASDGRRVRWGRVFRSGSLGELTPGDVATLGRLGIRLVCDLRSEEEAAEEPSRIPETATRLALPMIDDSVRPSVLRERITRGDVEGLDADLMRHAYVALLESHASSFGEALRRISTTEAPTLVHCTAGKDRTGLLSALLLLTLGVPEDVVLGDYQLTELYTWRRIRRASFFLLLRGIEAAPLRPLLGADPAVLEAALDALRETHGSVEAYLLGPAGLAAGDLARLRSRLLRPGET